MKYFIYTVISIVSLSVIAGFFIIDSPKEKRLRDSDQIRIQNIQYIQSEVINHFLAKDELPGTLGGLRKDISIPSDPETRMPYEYSIKNKNTFELCASFSLPSLPADGKNVAIPKPAYGPYGPYDESYWNHQAGRKCFVKEIDKDFYQPEKRL